MKPVKKNFKKQLLYPIVAEGNRSNLLDTRGILDEDSRGILDEDSRVIFQGHIYNSDKQIIGEFLISKYNGIDLEKKYSSSESGIIFTKDEKYNILH